MYSEKDAAEAASPRLPPKRKGLLPLAKAPVKREPKGKFMWEYLPCYGKTSTENRIQPSPFSTVQWSQVVGHPQQQVAHSDSPTGRCELGPQRANLPSSAWWEQAAMIWSYHDRLTPGIASGRGADNWSSTPCPNKARHSPAFQRGPCQHTWAGNCSPIPQPTDASSNLIPPWG